MTEIIKLLLLPIVPSMNILDQFLPLVQAAKSQDPSSKCLLVVDASRPVMISIFHDSDFWKHALDLCDGVLVVYPSGAVRLYSNMGAVSLRLWFLKRVRNFEQRWRSILGVGSKKIHSRRPRPDEAFLSMRGALGAPIVLSDPYVLNSHGLLKGFLLNCEPVEWVLAMHGSAVGFGPPVKLDFAGQTVRFLVHSEEEKKRTGLKFGLLDSQISVVLPPPLSESWLGYLRSRSDSKYSAPFAYLLSIPSSSKFKLILKARYIKCIAQASEESGLELRIRLHPKESRIKMRLVIVILLALMPRMRVRLDSRAAPLVAERAELIVLFSTSFDETVSWSRRPAVFLHPASSRKHFNFGLQDTLGRQLTPGEARGLYASSFTCSDFKTWVATEVNRLTSRKDSVSSGEEGASSARRDAADFFLTLRSELPEE